VFWGVLGAGVFIGLVFYNFSGDIPLKG